MQPLQQLKHGPSILLVQISGRFICQQHFRSGDERPGDCYTLLFPARKFSCAMFGPVQQAYFFEPLPRFCSAASCDSPRTSSGIATFSVAVKSGNNDAFARETPRCDCETLPAPCLLKILLRYFQSILYRLLGCLAQPTNAVVCFFLLPMAQRSQPSLLRAKLDSHRSESRVFFRPCRTLSSIRELQGRCFASEYLLVIRSHRFAPEFRL